MKDLYDKLIDAVIGECDTTNLDRGCARMQIREVLGATPERLAALKRVGDNFSGVRISRQAMVEPSDLRAILTLAGYYASEPQPINPAEALRSIAQQIGKDTGREVDEEAFDRLAALLGAEVSND